MWFFNVFFSLLSPSIPTDTLPADSVKIEFTFAKMEQGKTDQKNYYYQLSVQNTSSQSVYVIIPKWFETQPKASGIMRDVAIDSHDNLIAYSFTADIPFEIYKIAAFSSIKEQKCKIRTRSDFSKITKMEIPVYVVHEVKIGELPIQDYVQHKDFYGTNIPYSFVEASTLHETLALK